MSHLTSHVEKCHVMLCYLMSQNVISHPSHVTLCSFVIWQYIILTHFEDYELRLPTTFKGSFPSDPPSLSLSLSLLPLPPPPTVRVRQREGWRGTGKRESLVRRLLLSFLVCLYGQLIFQKGPRNRWSKANCSIFKISSSEAGIFSR